MDRLDQQIAKLEHFPWNQIDYKFDKIVNNYDRLGFKIRSFHKYPTLKSGEKVSVIFERK